MWVEMICLKNCLSKFHTLVDKLAHKRAEFFISRQSKARVYTITPTQWGFQVLQQFLR